MTHAWIMGLVFACSSPADHVEEATAGAAARAQADDTVVPACELATSCPELALDPLRCVSDGSLFEVTLLEGQIIAASLAVSPSETALPAGSWYTAFASASGACDEAVVLEILVPEEWP